MRKYTVYKMFQVDWQCSKCEKATVEFTGWTNTDADLLWYKHKCPKCKKTMMLMHRYPYLEHISNIHPDNLKKLKK